MHDPPPAAALSSLSRVAATHDKKYNSVASV